jgi:mycothiol synthase
MDEYANQNYFLRSFSDEKDYLSMLDLFNRCQNIDQIDKMYTLSSISQELQRQPNFDLSEQLLLIQSQNDIKILGMIGFNWREDIDGNWLYEFHHWMVDPEWRGIGIEKILMEKAEAWLVLCGKNHNPAGEKWLQTRIQDSQIDLVTLLETNGYTVQRRTIKMSRPTNLNLPQSKTPNGFAIRKAEPNEYRKVIQANDEAFQDLWGYSPKTEAQFQMWEQDRLFQPECWQVAWNEDEVAGMVLGFIDEEENSFFHRKRGYTEEIAVRRPWRRKGLARQLLTESIRMFNEKGMQETALSVDSHNQSGAYSFYLEMGYKPICEFCYYRKPLPVE